MATRNVLLGPSERFALLVNSETVRGLETRLVGNQIKYGQCKVRDC
jgi:hypothetical protein